MSLSKSFSIGADKLIFGEGNTDVNIVSKNGTNIKINGVVPSAGGGGGVPPVGDIDFIGNLNCNDVAGGGAKGIITAEKKINSGVGGIESTGNIKTQAGGDLKSGRNVLFNGQDIYKTYEGIVPQPANKTYKEYKNLIAPTDNTTFTGTTIFRDNAVSIQALNDDVPAVYENTITLNTNGNIQCDTTNNATQITTGTLICDNGGTNECRARVFNTRTSGTSGWNIKQALEESNPPGNQANNILQIAASQAQVAGEPVEVYITSSEYDPTNNDNPNIKLIPDTILNGGTIQASQFELGTATNRYYLKQDIGGPNDQVLQIKAPTTNASVNFKDNVNADVLVVKNTSIDLANTIPINFGSYSFRPQQYSLTRTLTISGTPDTTNFTNMAFNCRSDTWNNVNAGGTISLYNALLEGYYKCTITQTALSSSGNFNFCDIMFDYILHLSIQTTPDIDITEPAYNYRKKPTNQARPSIQIDHLNTPVQSQPVFVLYSGQNAGETMPIEVKLTKLDF